MGPMGPQGPQEGTGATPHGPYGAPMAPRGTAAPTWALWSPKGPQARRILTLLAGRAEIGIRTSDSGSKKKVEIWPIWTHGEHWGACPVIFVKRRGVKKSAFLMSYEGLKFSRKHMGQNVPGSQCRPEPSHFCLT